jgi:hypothetical protein
MLSRLPRALSGPLLVLLAACTSAAQAAPYVMYRDPGCPCCEDHAAHVRAELEQEVIVRDDRPMTEVKSEAGVPAELHSCHTMEAGGYIFEGHVPAREIARLLRERPDDIVGLSVPGMPLGSPGMEAGGRVQPYQVIAFGNGQTRVYASYP